MTSSVASGLLNDYIDEAGLRGATEKIPRGLTILTGAVPGRDRGFGHMAPTYLCRFPGSHSDGHRGSVLRRVPLQTRDRSNL